MVSLIRLALHRLVLIGTCFVFVVLAVSETGRPGLRKLSRYNKYLLST